MWSRQVVPIPRNENYMSLRMLVGLGADPLHSDTTQVGFGILADVM